MASSAEQVERDGDGKESIYLHILFLTCPKGVRFNPVDSAALLEGQGRKA